MADISKTGKTRLTRVGETYNALHCGQKTIGTAQEALSTTSIDCYGVIIQNDIDSTNNVAVGNETHGCYIQLTPGSNISIPVNNLNKVYLRGIGGEVTINWLAVQ